MQPTSNHNSKRDNSVFSEIWKEYETVIVHSLITSFGLDALIQDQYGGDVDTVHNVRLVGKDPNMSYKDSHNEEAYQLRGAYDSKAYHSHEKYKEINAKVSRVKKEGELIDAYTGQRVARNANIDLDHAIAAKEIHEDPGRILAGLDGRDLANCEENLNPTERSINRSMRETEIDKYLEKWKGKESERKERIHELKQQSRLSDKERKELEKLEKLDSIDPKLTKEHNDSARKSYEKKISNGYYTSPRFLRDTALSSVKRGVEVGARQALGLVFVEIWICTREDLQSIEPGCELSDVIYTIGDGIKKGVENAKNKYQEVVQKACEGFVAGALASLTTTLCNIFFTTAKNVARLLRQIYASVVQAGNVLLFNPDNLMVGDRIKTAAVILATGASIMLGVSVGEVISKTPIGMVPVIGSIVSSFCSTLVSGFISCTLLIFLDRSRVMNHIIDVLNAIPSEANNYREIADTVEAIAAKLENIDLDAFRTETKKYMDFSERISRSKDENDLNKILVAAYKWWDIEYPGDIGDKDGHLVFA